MFSLLYGLWKLYFRRSQYQTLIIGVDAAGKSTLIEQIRHLYLNTPTPDRLKIPPTVGLNLVAIDNLQQQKFIFWDLGGQQSLRVLWSKYYTECHAIVYVLDSTQVKERWEEVYTEFQKLLSEAALVDAPLLILANKQDLPAATAIDEISRRLQLSSITSRPLKLLGISALTGLGVENGMRWLLDVVPTSKRAKRIVVDTN